MPRRLIVIAAAVAVLVAAYAAAGFWLVPNLVRSKAEGFADEHYGRKLAIGDVRFNPFTLRLAVDDLSFPDADGEVLASFDRLLVNLGISTLWRRGPSFQEIAIEKPYARVLVREGAELNLADLAKPFAKAPEEPEEDDEDPPRIFIDLFRMDGGHVSFIDRTLAVPYTTDVTPLSFELRDFSTTESTDNAYDLQARAGSGATLDWSGSFSWAPFESQGRFRFANVSVTAHEGYLRDAAGLDVSSGRLDFDGEYRVAAGEGGTQLTAKLRELTIDALGIKPVGAGTDTARFEKLTLSNATLDLGKRTAGIEKVLVSGGSVEARREADGRINLAELGKKPEAGQPQVPEEAGGEPAQPQPAPAPAPAPSPWLFTAPDIELAGLVVQVEDRQVDPAIKLMLDPFNLRVTGFSTAPGTKLAVATDARIDGAATLNADLAYGLDERALEGKASLAGFDLTVIQPYLDRYTRMDLLSGVLTTELALTLLADGGFAANGDVQVDRLRSVDKAMQEDFIKWDRLRAEGFSYDGRTADFRIRRLRLRAPYARVIIAKDETVNVKEVMTPATPQPAYRPTVQVATPEGPPPQETKVRIDAVSIENGSLNFADYWIQPNYAVSIQQLDGVIADLSSDPKTRATLDLEGKVDRYAPATISGEMNLLSAALFTNIRLQFAGVDMSTVTPYSGRFAGYEIEKGKLSVDVTYHVEDRKLDAQQKFVVDQLQLGDRVESPDAVSLPLKLAVALLKDRNGVIDLDLPVSGSLDDPKFRLGPIIWKAFVGLLKKIATAPFALIGNLFGGGPEVNSIEFAPGQVTLDPAGQEKMASVRKALVERPSLQVDVPMAYSAELDGGLIARQALEADLRRLAGSQRNLVGRRPDESQVAEMLADPMERFELLAKHWRAGAGEKAALPGEAAAFEAMKKRERTPEAAAAAVEAIERDWLESHAATAEQLESLGKARAQSVQEALLGSGEVEPARVFLIRAESQPPGAAKVKLELSLK